MSTGKALLFRGNNVAAELTSLQYARRAGGSPG